MGLMSSNISPSPFLGQNHDMERTDLLRGQLSSIKSWLVCTQI